jgi:hypothetical protein
MALAEGKPLPSFPIHPSNTRASGPPGQRIASEVRNVARAAERGQRESTSKDKDVAHIFKASFMTFVII